VRDKIKALSWQTVVYGTGHILSRLVTFLLLPLYTNIFDAAEYGVISLAYTFMGFMGVILHYGLDAALLKRYVQADQAERPRYLTTAYCSFLITSLLSALSITALSIPLAPVLLGGPYARFLVLIAGILLFDILWSIPQLLLRAEQKPLVFITFNLVNVLGTLTLNILLVVYLKMGVGGVLWSNLIMSGLLFLVTLPIVLRRARWSRVSLAAWKQLMRFGLPFLPSGIFAMLMELVDRYLLKSMTDMATVGLYSAGYKLGMLMLLVVMGFNMAWQPFFLREGPTTGATSLFARITTYVLAGLGFLWILLLVWVNDIVRLQVGPVTVYGSEFWTSTAVVPWVALGYVFHGAYLLQLPGVFQLEKSSWVAITRGVGAGVNIVLNLLLIPRYQALGAAYATCLSFLVMAVFLFMVNRKLYTIGYEWWRLLRIGLFMLLAYVLQDTSAPTITNKILLSLILPVGLLVTGFFNRQELAYLRLRKPR